MIWVDSSFAIEWLGGIERAAHVDLSRETLGILTLQYAETCTFFLRQGHAPQVVANDLESLILSHPEKIHLQLAASLYLEARKPKKSKVSLADAILAAVAYERREKILSFDNDFAFLGFREKDGIWLRSS